MSLRGGASGEENGQHGEQANRLTRCEVDEQFWDDVLATVKEAWTISRIRKREPAELQSTSAQDAPVATSSSSSAATAEKVSSGQNQADEGKESELQQRANDRAK